MGIEEIIGKFEGRLVKFQKEQFDVLLQSKTKKYLYDIGVPAGYLIGAMQIEFDGKLRILDDFKVQISAPFDDEDNTTCFYLDSNKNDALFYYSSYYNQTVFVNSSLENFMLSFHEIEDFHENVYSKRTLGDVFDEGVAEKYALYLEKRLKLIDENIPFWDGEVEDIETRMRL